MVVDESRKPSGISNEEIVAWYRNMLSGMSLSEDGVNVQSGLSDGLASAL